MGGEIFKKRQSLRDIAPPSKAFINNVALTDSISGADFVIDTGASISAYPVAMLHSTPPASPTFLVAANGSKIATYGEKKISFCLNGEHYSWTFLIADVKKPLVGKDFLSSYELLVDAKRNKILKR